ncbi:hypothetical protein MKX01_030438 [Papaver californicum]|nr:hypothetical protein MKX01_030438 [Papaver californicum]
MNVIVAHHLIIHHLFAAILFLCVLNSKNISIYNEKLIVAGCFRGFVLLTRRRFGDTFQATFDARTKAIQEELQQVLNPNEALLQESKEQELESLPTARCVPQCKKTVQASLCRNLIVKSSKLRNANSSRRISLQDEIMTGFHVSVSERFILGSTTKASIV